MVLAPSATVDEEAPAVVPAASAATTSSGEDTPAPVLVVTAGTTLMEELWSSTEVLFRSKLTWLLITGPLALFGDQSGYIGEASCFALAGIALIPCAER